MVQVNIFHFRFKEKLSKEFFFSTDNLPYPTRAFTTQEVQEIGLFSENFKVETCFECLLGSTEKIKRPKLTAGELEDLVEWCCFFPGKKIQNNKKN